MDDLLLSQDLPGLCRCAPLTSNAAMRGARGPSLHMPFASQELSCLRHLS